MDWKKFWIPQRFVFAPIDRQDTGLEGFCAISRIFYRRFFGCLFLACLGSGFLFHGFLNHRMPEIATLISLGASRTTALRIFIFQLLLLGLLASIPAILACSFILPALGSVISGISSTGIEVAVSLQTVLITLGVALCSGCLLALPSLSKLKRLQPSQLFQEAARPGSQPSRYFLLYALPGLSGFWILCLVQSHSDKLANIFFA